MPVRVVVLACVLSTGLLFPTAASADDLPALAAATGGTSGAGASAGSRSYVGVDGSAVRFHRGEDFVFGRELSNLFPFETRNDLKYGLDGWGGGGALTAGYWLMPRLAVELGFSGATQSTRSSREFNQTGGPGSDGGFPLIEGSIRGQQEIIFAGSTTPGSATLDYDQTIYDVHLDGRYRLWESPTHRSFVDAVAGFAYLHLDQEFDDRVTGFNNVAFTTVSTDIDMTDNLYGVRVGVRGGTSVGSPKLRIVGAVLGDFYARETDLDAHQSGQNMLISFTGTRFPVDIRRDETDEGFVPRLEASLGVLWGVTRNVSVGLGYAFDVLRQMSRLDTPRARCVIATCSVDHTLRIADGSTLTMHALGIKVSLEF